MKQDLATALMAAIVAIVLVAGRTPALAQVDTGSEPPTADTRYILQPSGEGFVRLDRVTGQMSYCVAEDGRLTCRLAADDRDAYEEEIGRLEARLKALGEPSRQKPSATPDDTPEDGPPNGPLDGPLDGPTAEEERQFEKAMDYAERALRRFFDVVEELRADLERRQETR